ncbi:hypothetical protein OROGR_029582 [Orobanche gracilis]
MARSGAFPPVDAEKELNPGVDKDFQLDPISSDVAKTKEIEGPEQIRAKKIELEEHKQKKKKESMQSLKTTLIVSGIVVAVVGAVFAITKKLKEK